MIKLHCTWRDGAHWGLTDWYPELESAIVDALSQDPEYAWTTDWYASKKEIASACLSYDGENLICEAHVSDDLDTEGNGTVVIPWTDDLDKIREAIDRAWEEANANQKDNRLYVGYKICDERGYWVETYLQPAGVGHYLDYPPGDNYHQWGWQEDSELPEEVCKAFEEHINEYREGPLTIGGFTLSPWED